jgi:hypothetical protein
MSQPIQPKCYVSWDLLYERSNLRSSDTWYDTEKWKLTRDNAFPKTHE